MDDLSAFAPYFEVRDEKIYGGEKTSEPLDIWIDGEGAVGWGVTAGLPEPVVEAERGEKRKNGGAEAGPSSLSLAANDSCEEKDDESSATKKRKTASASVEISYEVVEEDEQIEPAMKKLRELGEGLPLAVDLEGKKLSRKGKLSILSVATENDTFLFDIQKLGAGVFDKGLRDLLQDPDRQKLMFDCRQDSNFLWHQYKVKLTNVLDLQLMEVIYRGDASTHQMIDIGIRKHGHNSDIRVPRVLTLQRCLEDYVKDEDLINARKINWNDLGWWSDRPFSRGYLRFVAVDVIGMLQFYRVLWDKFNKMNAMKQLQDGSNRYIDFYRLKENLSDDGYEDNRFLPWRIFSGTYNKDVQCVGCKRYFPCADFSKRQRKQRVPKCPVCKIVKKEEDEFEAENNVTSCEQVDQSEYSSE